MTTPWQPGFQGVSVVAPTYTDPHTATSAALQLVATTGTAGVALVNGTPGILTWNAPNDNQLHRVFVVAHQVVTALETGGLVNIGITFPDGAAHTSQVYAGGSAAGFTPAFTGLLAKGGTTVTLQQASALTGGAATIWAEIWAA